MNIPMIIVCLLGLALNIKMVTCDRVERTFKGTIWLIINIWTLALAMAIFVW